MTIKPWAISFPAPLSPIIVNILNKTFKTKTPNIVLSIPPRAPVNIVPPIMTAAIADNV